MRRANMKVASGVVAMAAILAACGGGDGGDADDAPAGPAPPPESAGTEAAVDPRSDAERQADQEAAEAALLTVEDFDGFAAFEEPWQALAGSDDTGGDATGGEDAIERGADAADEEDDSGDILAQVAECLGLQEGLFGDEIPQATSPTFHAPESLIVPFVSAQVTYAASKDDMVQAVRVLQREQVPRCLETVVEDNLVAPGEEVPADVEFGQTAAEEIPVAELGDEVVAFRVTTPVAPVQSTGPALDEFAVNLFAELRVARVGRVGVTLFLQSQIGEFPEEEADRLTRSVLDRIPADTADAGEEAAPAAG